MEAVGLNEDVEEFEKEHDVYDFSRITGKDPFDFEKYKNDPPRRGSKRKYVLRLSLIPPLLTVHVAVYGHCAL